MSRLDEANFLRQKITSLGTEQKSSVEKLRQLERDCQHQWSDPVYCPEYIPAYTIPGDPPGTMGVDWRGPVDVPAKTIKRWSRQCQLCGKKEVTENVKKDYTQKPRF